MRDDRDFVCHIPALCIEATDAITRKISKSGEKFWWRKERILVVTHVPKATSFQTAHLSPGHTKQILETSDTDGEANLSLCIGPLFS